MIHDSQKRTIFFSKRDIYVPDGENQLHETFEALSARLLLIAKTENITRSRIVKIISALRFTGIQTHTPRPSPYNRIKDRR